MPRNTFLLVSLLAVIASFLVGIRLGQRLNTVSSVSIQTPTPTAETEPSPPSPAPPQRTPYDNTACGVSFTYPTSFTIEESSTGATLVDPLGASNPIILTCQFDIPRPPVSTDKIDTLTVASISAQLYHTASAKDGASVDELIFRHPKTGLDIFVSGLGPVFQDIISSLELF